MIYKSVNNAESQAKKDQRIVKKESRDNDFNTHNYSIPNVNPTLTLFSVMKTPPLSQKKHFIGLSIGI